MGTGLRARKPRGRPSGTSARTLPRGTAARARAEPRIHGNRTEKRLRHTFAGHSLPHLRFPAAGPGLPGIRSPRFFPLGSSAVRAMLKKHDIGRITLKKRGVEIIPEKEIKRLDPRGSREAILFYTRIRGEKAAILALPLHTNSKAEK